MNRVVRASTVLILAVGCWETGGIVMHSEVGASQNTDRSPGGEVIQLAATSNGATRVAAAEGAGVEVRPVAFVVTASEEWVLPREGTRRLQLRPRSGRVSRIRLAPIAGDEIRVHVVREAEVEREAEAKPLLTAMRIERRREGDAWVVEAGWPYSPRRRRTGPHSYKMDDPRSVAFEVHLPRGVRLDVTNADLSGTDLAGQDLREVSMEGANLSGPGCGRPTWRARSYLTWTCPART